MKDLEKIGFTLNDFEFLDKQLKLVSMENEDMVDFSEEILCEIITRKAPAEKRDKIMAQFNDFKSRRKSDELKHKDECSIIRAKLIQLKRLLIDNELI